MIKHYGSIKIEQVDSDGYLFWFIEIEKAGQYKKKGLSVGLRAKIVDDAIKENVHKLVIRLKEPEIQISIKPKEFKKMAIKDKFPSRYGPAYDMNFYYLPIYSFIHK